MKPSLLLLAGAALRLGCLPAPIEATPVDEPPPELDHFAVCETPIDPQRTCDSVGDCWNGNQCDDDICDLNTPPDPPDPNGRKGTCRWEPRPDGAPCDLPGREGTDACVRGLCCAVEGGS
jgi:hypothetical protein